MNRGIKFFLAALTLIVIALCVHFISPASALTTLGFIAFGVTVTYAYPVSGSTAPTAAQVSKLSMVTAVLNWADGETTATITHNFGLSSAQLANLWPIPAVYATALNGSPVTAPIINIATNTIVLTKTSAAGTGGTYNVVVYRPYSGIE